MADWTVEFYQEPSGRCPVLGFIKSLPAKAGAKILRTLDLLEEFGPLRGVADTRQIEGPLWEVRVRTADHHLRLLYFLHAQRRIICLHGFAKRSAKTPRKEIEVALRRMADFLERRE